MCVYVSIHSVCMLYMCVCHKYMHMCMSVCILCMCMCMHMGVYRCHRHIYMHAHRVYICVIDTYMCLWICICVNDVLCMYIYVDGYVSKWIWVFVYMVCSVCTHMCI